MTESKPSRLRFVRGVALALLGGVSWAASGTSAEFLFETQGLNALWVTSVRLLIAGVLFLLIAAVVDRSRLSAAVHDRRNWGSFAMVGIFGILFCQFSYLTAISYSDSGTTTVLSMVGLIFIMVYSCRISHRLPRKRELTGLILTLIGVVLIATHGDITRLAMPLPALIWGLLSALGLAAYNLMPVRLIGRFGSLVTMGVSMFIAGVCMCVLTQPWTEPVELNASVLFGMFMVIIVGTIIASWVYMQAIADIGPVKSSMIAAVEPIAATVFTAVFLGTEFPLIDLIGFACIIAMVLLVSSKPDDPADIDELPHRGVAAQPGVDYPAPTADSFGISKSTAPAPMEVGDDADADDDSSHEETTVLWDPVVTKKAMENETVAAQDLTCSPEAAHLVHAKANTKDTVRHGMRERIALCVFGVLIVGGFAALTTYIVAGHNLNYASTSIDDISGDMTGYGVILFEGTVVSSDAASTTGVAASSNAASSETAKDAATSESETPVDTIATLLSGGSGDDDAAASEAASSKGEISAASTSTKDSEVRDPVTMEDAQALYNEKNASVLTLDVNDFEHYRNGRIIMQGGHSFGIVSLTDDLVDSFSLPIARITTTTTTTTTGKTASASAATSTRTKNAYTNFSELLGSVEAVDFKTEAMLDVQATIDHFHDAGVDTVIVMTSDARPCIALESVDIVIEVKRTDRFTQSATIDGTLYIDTPEVDCIGALLVAPGNVVSSRTLSGAVTRAGIKAIEHDSQTATQSEATATGENSEATDAASPQTYTSDQ